MNIESIRKEYASTQVDIVNIAVDRQVSDDLLIGFAMHAAGENPSRLFGWKVCRFTEGDVTVAARVSLHTD